MIGKAAGRFYGQNSNVRRASVPVAKPCETVETFISVAKIFDVIFAECVKKQRERYNNESVLIIQPLKPRFYIGRERWERN